MKAGAIVVAADHGGVALKDELVRALEEWGWRVEDLGTHGVDSVDYPDYASALCRRVAAGAPPVGVLVCGTGIGMSIAANRRPGIRAALCADSLSASMARAHNDANVLCLGGRIIGPELAKAVLRAFVDGEFEGERHRRRLDKIEELALAEDG